MMEPPDYGHTPEPSPEPQHPGFLHHAWTVWCWFVTWHARGASAKDIFKNPDAVFYIMGFIALLATALLIKRHVVAWKANRGA